MKRIGIIFLIGLMCISIVGCKQQESVGNQGEKKTSQEIVKNPSEQLPLRYQKLKDGDGNELLIDITEVSVIDIQKKLANGIKERYNLIDSVDEIMQEYQVIKVTGEINSSNQDVFLSHALSSDFDLYIDDDKIELPGEPFYFSEERFEDQGKTVESIALVVKKAYIKTGALQLEIQTYINREKNKVFVDVVKE